MLWKDAKRIIAILGIVAIVGRSFLGLISYAPLLQDSEFDEALQRAEEIGIKDVGSIQDKPFGFITRAEAASWYVAFAQSSDFLLYSDDICVFNDIDTYDGDTLDMIMLSCMYRFFRGSNGGYFPESYLTKAGSIVALMKGFFPTKEYQEIEPYRDPFVTDAKEMGITKRDSDPYMMYLVTKYELLLQLYRAYEWKNGNF